MYRILDKLGLPSIHSLDEIQIYLSIPQWALNPALDEQQKVNL